jgi:uncharacterized NAD(P)/FAD-binding protein YdhS
VKRPFDILILGGGFSGTMLAIQLLRRDPRLNVAVVDKGKTPGRGLAYSTYYRFHVLNVPVKNMSALPEDSEHFLNWARNNHDSQVKGESFLPRAVYGRYLDSLLLEALSRCGKNLTWFPDEALLLTRNSGAYHAQLKGGEKLVAHAVVIATGNLPPGDPPALASEGETNRYVSVALSGQALECLYESPSVLLIGAGLTAVDLAIGLVTSGFQGKIHMLSRRGLTPQDHRETKPWPQFWNQECPRTVRGLVGMIRSQVRAAAASGVDWRSVIDALRPVTQEIWRSLPQEERRRFMRHARPYWDAHRHRVAPEVGDLLSHLIQEGQLQLYAGRITGYREDADQVLVTFRCRPGGRIEQLTVGHVVNCTGPEADWRRIDNSLLNSLFAQELAKPDPLFLGLDVDSVGAVVDKRGVSSKSLFAIGPVRKGSLWETTAVPELRKQASDLAEHLLNVLNEERARNKVRSPSVDRSA